MKEMIFDDDCDLNGLNNQYLEDNSSYEKFSWEFEPLEEIEPHYEEKEPFEVVLVQTLTKLDSHVFNTNSHLLSQERRIQNHELYEDQISSIITHSLVEGEK